MFWKLRRCRWSRYSRGINIYKWTGRRLSDNPRIPPVGLNYFESRLSSFGWDAQSFEHVYRNYVARKFRASIALEELFKYPRLQDRFAASGNILSFRFRSYELSAQRCELYCISVYATFG